MENKKSLKMPKGVIRSQ